ncbi:MAG: Coenzyme F420 hydrogenase/dehydrogenase, beta subunit C-terminal domain [Opitutaceae bacterium]|nr:Coenzyme F420 hydrogenase/dehydrogenase, beta subunit C-terminal domain [Opitutaceae bacterium]
MRKFRKLSDVVDWGMCLGCGACAYACPEKAVQLRNIEEIGIRPHIDNAKCTGCEECLAVCPAVGLDGSAGASRPGIIKEVFPMFGPILEIWEGHAGDPEIRYKGSSGGALTALSLHALEDQGFHGVLQVGQDPKDPILNTTRLSKTRSDLLACVGSRYSPASVCDSLHLVEEAPGPCVIVGQPSEIGALSKVLPRYKQLNNRVGLTLSFFCAGSPATSGTTKMLARFNVERSGLQYTRYRGHGWPGYFSTQAKGSEKVIEHMAYGDAWAFIQRDRPISTHLFPDSSGEFADISCGDPWYRPVQPGEHGSSLIVVRTERGRAFLKEAINRGHLVAKPATVDQLIKSQGLLARKRGEVWGRILAFKLFGVPTPVYQGYCLFKNFLALGFAEKSRSLVGTVKRIVARKYYKRRPISR